VGELVIVGTGIQIGRDFTATAQHHIKTADKVYFLVAELVAAQTILDLNPRAESLENLYSDGKRRLDTYREMVDRILAALADGQNVCVAVYGHPGVFAYPMHEAIRKAREAGFAARMLPAVSSIDCLIADLAIDPAAHGMQIYDASDFVVSRRPFDTTTALVLLQIDVVGEPSYKQHNNRGGLPLLRERLTQRYGDEHEAIVYSASEYVWGNPSVRKLTLRALSAEYAGPGSILFVPARESAAIDEPTIKQLDALVSAAQKN